MKNLGITSVRFGSETPQRQNWTSESVFVMKIDVCSLQSIARKSSFLICGFCLLQNNLLDKLRWIKVK